MKPVAIVFDLFGTLLDIGSLKDAAARYVADGAALVATWREKQLAYAFAATMMDRYEDFDSLTARALQYAVARHGLSSTQRGWEALADEWRKIQPYADALPTLVQLRAQGWPCAILTNGTHATASAALSSARLADVIDVTLSVDTVRRYKPDARVYALATAHFATASDRIVFVSANGWDATGAAEFGLPVVWCNRTHAPAETFGAPPALTIDSLSELPERLTDLR